MFTMTAESAKGAQGCSFRIVQFRANVPKSAQNRRARVGGSRSKKKGALGAVLGGKKCKGLFFPNRPILRECAQKCAESPREGRRVP